MDGKGWGFSAKNFLIIIALLSATIALPNTASAAQLTLTWKDNANNEDGFEVERRTGTTGTLVIATKGPNTTSHTDSNLASGTTYCYRVRSFNAAGDSAYSNQACGTTTSSSNLSLTVNKAGNGSGTVSSTPAGINCGSDCFESYAKGTSVTLTATPATGSTFGGWSGGCSGTGKCTIIANTTLSITATFNTSTASPPSPSGVVFAVNAGGPQYVAPDGTVYKADTAFSGGSTYRVTAPIAGTDQDPLYQSERYGNFTYNVPVANGTYAVTFKFAEIYWSAAGKRIFDALLEGKEVLSNVDLFAKVGKNKAYDITSTVKVTDGVLNIRFRTDVNNAKVSAIKVVFASN